MTLRSESERLPKNVSRALPVYATATREEAESLKMMSCQLAYGGEGRYFLWREGLFTGEIDQLDGVTSHLRELHKKICAYQKRELVDVYPFKPIGERAKLFRK